MFHTRTTEKESLLFSLTHTGPKNTELFLIERAHCSQAAAPKMEPFSPFKKLFLIKIAYQGTNPTSFGSQNSSPPLESHYTKSRAGDMEDKINCSLSFGCALSSDFKQHELDVIVLKATTLVFARQSMPMESD